MSHRYAAFAFEDYYPSGGWGDFHCSASSIEEAKEKLKIAVSALYLRPDRWQIIDVTTFTIAESGGYELF